MVSADTALSILLQQVQPLQAPADGEIIPLPAALGRVLAQAIHSDLDFPPWDNSAMDGYGVRHGDVEGATPDHPVGLTVVTSIPAGTAPQRDLGVGEAARILTGGMVPLGADTIVMQEHTRREGDRVWVLEAPPRGAFIRSRGSYFQGGGVLLPGGIRIQAAEMGILAAAQCLQVPVVRRPRVAILSTGQELVPPGHPLQPGQIVDSNHVALTALVASMGAEPVDLGIVPDDLGATQRAIACAVDRADMVVSSGGVSVGDHDYVERSLEGLGARIQIRAVAIKPGKPLTVATLIHGQRSVVYVGLPGNPASAMVGFWRFVQPALGKLSGVGEPWGPWWVQGRSRQDLPAGGGRELYLWGRVQGGIGGYEFSLAAGGHGSGNLINLQQTNALAVVPVGHPGIGAGDGVTLMLCHLGYR